MFDKDIPIEHISPSIMTVCGNKIKAKLVQAHDYDNEWFLKKSLLITKGLTTR
jgi:hypothetical protein